MDVVKNIVFDADKKLYAADGVQWAIVEEYLVGQLVDPPVDKHQSVEGVMRLLSYETGRREAAEKALEAVKADRSVYILAKYANQTIEFTMNGDGFDGEMVSWKPASQTLTITYKNRNLSQSYSFFEEKI